MSKTILRASAAALAITAYSAPAIAQEEDSADELRQDLVTVTARKTAENVQETPVAVSVVSSDAIENLSLQDLSDISKLTAGLTFDNEFGRDSNRPVIRGQANILGDSGVSYFIDGVRISGAITDYDLNDVERVEVVKGPQSALYGRNTYSGAINIITKSPSDEFSARISAEIAEFEQSEFSAGISGPITDTLSGGLSYRHYELNDPFTNQFDGSPIGVEETNSFSGVLFWEPLDNLSLRLRGYRSESDDGQPALFATDPSENNVFIDNGALYGGDGRYFQGVIAPRDVNTDYTRQIAGNAGTAIDNTQFSLGVDADFSDTFSMSYIFGYNKRDINNATDGDYTPNSFQASNFVPGGFPINIISFVPFSAVYGYPTGIVDFTFSSESEEKEVSQELRFDFEGERSRLLVGGFFLDREDFSQDTRDRTLPANAQSLADANFAAELASQQIVCGFNPTCITIVPLGSSSIDVPMSQSTFNIENAAIFALVEYDVSDTVSVTLEGRYAQEDIERIVPGEARQEASFEKFSPRATFDWQVTPNNFLYGVYAEGQKPGGFNSVIAANAGFGTFDEEDVRSFEIGSKNEFFDQQLVANIAVFFNEIDGYQLTQNVATMTNTISATVNAGDAEILGLEGEFTFRPKAIDGLTGVLNYAYTDSEFTRGRDQNEGVLLDAADDGLVNGSVGCEFVDPADPTNCLQNAFGSIVGRQIPRTAEHQLFVDLDYRAPIGMADWEWFTGANLSYESSKFSQVHNLAETGEATLVNARIGATNGQYTIHLWGKNLTDEDSTPLVLRYASANDSFQRNFVGTLRRGTQVGLTLSAEF